MVREVHYASKPHAFGKAEPSSAEAERANSSSARLVGVPAAYNFDATRLGAESVAVLPLPQNRSRQAVTLTVRVEGDGFRLNSMWALHLGAEGGAKPAVAPDAPRVIFAPTRPGSYRGTLLFEARFADGSTERHATRLAGESAREAQPTDGNDSTTGLLGRLPAVDLGEQIIGSQHSFPVIAPLNRSTRPAIAKARLAGDPALAAKWGHFGTDVDLEPGLPARPIDLTFRPSKAGEYRGELCVSARWHDGHAQEVSTPVFARARSLLDVPRASQSLAQTVATNGAPALPRASVESHKAPVDWEAAGAHEQLGGALRGLFAFRRTGVDVIEREQMSYKPPALARSLWWDLMELAISLAGEAIGKIVERAVMRHLEKSVGVVMTKQVHKTPAPSGISSAAKQHNGRDDSSGAIALKATKDVETLAASATKAIVSAAKTKSVAAGKAALPAGLIASDDGADVLSENQSIAFFAEQHNALMSAEQSLGPTLLDLELGIREVAGPHSGIANLLVGEMANGLIESQRHAQVVQMQETTAQWLAYKARASLGVESASRHGSAVTVTKLSKTREFQKLHPPCTVAGMVDIYVDRVGSSWRVTGARVNGVSSLVANRLLTANLRAARIPIRFVLVDGAGYVTRDEAGRVRYSGFLHLDPDAGPGMPDEKNEIRTAEQVVDLVLGRTLASWGVKTIRTDDEGGHS